MVVRACDVPHHLLLSFPFTLPPPSPNPNPNFSPALPLSRSRLFRCTFGPGRSDQSWDSNAENVRTGRFRFRDNGGGGREEEDGGFWKREKRKWWSDDSSDQLDEESELFDDVVENLWDKIWIFKVFKSYGYLLPAIIASMLLATGPKAFLMALALPLGQSALSLAIEKVWGKVREGPKPKANKKPFARSANDFKRPGGKGATVNEGRQGYQSWVAADFGGADRRSDWNEGSFGGWDELDRRGEYIKEPIRRQPPRTRDSPPQDQPVKKGKLTRRGKNRDVPLFLRLLIAVFPFLGSWTRIL